MILFDEIVFGPIKSRRLGSSLGVNLLPRDRKVCNFDCTYCECGWNKDSKGNSFMPTREQVRLSLENKLKDPLDIDSITFSGNGEPTLHPEFCAIIDDTLELRDRYCPKAKVSVLSNSTTIINEEIRKALSKVDNPILKLDAPRYELISKINKPKAGYDLEKVLEGLKKMDGNFILQTMFTSFEGFDTRSFIFQWIDIVRRLHPREIMAYTIDRQTPVKTMEKFSLDEIKKLILPLASEGIKLIIA